MDPDVRRVDEDVFEIGIVRQGLENPLPDAFLRPAPEARVDAVPFAERARQIAPRAPVRAIHKTASMNSRLSDAVAPGSPALPGSSGAIRSHCSWFRIVRIKADLHFSALNQNFAGL